MTDSTICIRNGLRQDKGIPADFRHRVSNFIKSALRIPSNSKAEKL